MTHVNTNQSINSIYVSMALLCSLLCCSCGGINSKDRYLPQMTVEVPTSTRGHNDLEIESDSLAMHHFMLAELEYNRKDLEQALHHYTEAEQHNGVMTLEVRRKLVEIYIHSGRLEEALAQCESALADDPDDEMLMFYRAGILESLDRSDQAQAVFREIIAKDPKNVKAYISLAVLFIMRQQYDEGIAVLQDLLKQSPDEADGYYYLGKAYQHQKNLKGALEQYLKAFDLDPDNRVVVRDVLLTFLQQKQYKQAKDFSLRVLAEDPNNTVALRVISQLMIGDRDLDSALEYLQVLETIDDDPTDTHYTIALIQVEKQRFSEADRHLRLVLSAQPDHDQARYLLATVLVINDRSEEALVELGKIKPEQSMFLKGRILTSQLMRDKGDLLNAEKILRETLEHHQSDRSLLLALIFVLREKGESAEICSLLGEITEWGEESEALLYLFGEALYKVGDKQAAMATMEKLLVLHPDYPSALNFIAYNLAEDKRDLERALSMINRALSIDPNDSNFIDTRGWIYFQLEEYERAFQDLKRSTELAPNDVVILEHYGDTLLKLGKKAAASKVYQRVLLQVENKDVDQEDLVVIERVRLKLEALQGEED